MGPSCGPPRSRAGPPTQFHCAASLLGVFHRSESGGRNQKVWPSLVATPVPQFAAVGRVHPQAFLNASTAGGFDFRLTSVVERFFRGNIFQDRCVIGLTELPTNSRSNKTGELWDRHRIITRPARRPVKKQHLLFFRCQRHI